ncbi:sporulation-induced protein [Cryptotrichosporon argae]
MLWRFSFASTSTLETLLSRESRPSLEELLDEQDILSEVKSQNNKLVTFLEREDSVRGLLHWVTAGLDELDAAAAAADSASFAHVLAAPDVYPSYQRPASPAGPAGVEARVRPGPGSPPLEPAADDDEGSATPKGIGLGEGLEAQDGGSDEQRRARYPQVATEILTAELWTLAETVMANKDALLIPFWDAVVPPLPAAEDAVSTAESGERQRARDELWSDEDEERERRREMIRGMWTRVNSSLLTRRPGEMIRFIQSLPNIVERIMARIESPAVQDMLARIIQTEGVPGVIDWLASEQLVDRLVDLLSPARAPHLHTIAADLLKGVVIVAAPGAPEPQHAVRDNRLVRQLAHADTVRRLVGFMLDDVTYTDTDWKPTGAPTDPFVVHRLPSVASATSSLCQVCNVLVEVVRRNNSDWAEPYLFNTLRNRLMNLQGQPPADDESEGDEGEDAGRHRMESLVEELSAKFGIVHLGAMVDALTARFDDLHRLLLLPRSQARVGSSANPRPVTMERFRVIEVYAELLHSSNMSILNRADGPAYSAHGELAGGLDGLDKLGQALQAAEAESAPEEQVKPARELPVSSGSTDYSLTESDEMTDDDSTDGDAPRARTEPTTEPAVPPPPSQADADRLRDVMESDAGAPSSPAPPATIDPADEAQHEPRPTPLGDRLKAQFLAHGVLKTLIDLFFDHPNNNFLHHVVYDVFQQVLNGPLTGANRDLIVNLFGEAELIERILDAQRLNDERVAQRQPRRANMGAVSLITEEVLKLLGRAPADLHDALRPTFDPKAWGLYVDGPFKATRARDAQLLAGGKPAMTAQGVLSQDGTASGAQAHAQIGEPLSRTVAAQAFGESRGGGSDGDGDGDDSDGDGDGDGRGAAHFWQPSGRTVGGDSSDDDDDADWLRPSGRAHSDDEFGGFTGAAGRRGEHGDDDDDDDAWGTFASGAGSGGGGGGDASNPFDDDAFAPSGSGARELLTPADWAHDFDSAFDGFDGDGDGGGGVASGPNSGSGSPAFGARWPADPVDEDEDGDGDGDGTTAIVVPTLDDSLDLIDPADEPPRDAWSVPAGEGEGEGEDLPPAHSPVIGSASDDDDDLAHATRRLTIEPAAQPRPLGEPITTAPARAAATVTSPASAPPAPAPPAPSSPGSPDTPHPAAALTRFDGPSPPDPALLAAATDGAPLGPGVSADTTLTDAGMLRKQVAGEVVTVPADEVARSVDEAMHG